MMRLFLCHILLLCSFLANAGEGHHVDVYKQLWNEVRQIYSVRSLLIDVVAQRKQVEAKIDQFYDIGPTDKMQLLDLQTLLGYLMQEEQKFDARLVGELDAFATLQRVEQLNKLVEKIHAKLREACENPQKRISLNKLIGIAMTAHLAVTYAFQMSGHESLFLAWYGQHLAYSELENRVLHELPILQTAAFFAEEHQKSQYEAQISINLQYLKDRQAAFISSGFAQQDGKPGLTPEQIKDLYTHKILQQSSFAWQAILTLMGERKANAPLLRGHLELLAEKGSSLLAARAMEWLKAEKTRINEQSFVSPVRRLGRLREVMPEKAYQAHFELRAPLLRIQHQAMAHPVYLAQEQIKWLIKAVGHCLKRVSGEQVEHTMLQEVLHVHAQGQPPVNKPLLYQYGGWQLTMDHTYYIKIQDGYKESSYWRHQKESDTYASMQKGLTTASFVEHARLFVAEGGAHMPTDGQEANEARAIYAKFLAEPARKLSIWCVNLMMLDLMDVGLLNIDQFFNLHPMQGGSYTKQAKEASGKNLEEVLTAEAVVVMNWLSNIISGNVRVDIVTDVEDSYLQVPANSVAQLEAFYASLVAELLWKRTMSTQRWDDAPLGEENEPSWAILKGNSPLQEIASFVLSTRNKQQQQSIDAQWESACQSYVENNLR